MHLVLEHLPVLLFSFTPRCWPLASFGLLLRLGGADFVSGSPEGSFCETFPPRAGYNPVRGLPYFAHRRPSPWPSFDSWWASSSSTAFHCRALCQGGATASALRDPRTPKAPLR